MEKNKKSFREEFVSDFVDYLKSDNKTSFKQYFVYDSILPNIKNASTNKRYNGLNQIALLMESKKKGYGDNRWATFKQIQDKGWKLKKGARGSKIEYVMPFDKEDNKFLTWDKYNELCLERINPDRYKLVARYFTVFNGNFIEGIEPIKIKETSLNIEEIELVERIADSLGVSISYMDNFSKAYYMPSEDAIYLPNIKQFNSKGGYLATAIHELSHATGHSSRLDRGLEKNKSKKDKKYAYEELVAEFTSVFLSEYVKEDRIIWDYDNNKAYLDSWLSSIDENKNFLFKAIKDAEKASDYIIEKANLREYLAEKSINKSEEIKKYISSPLTEHSLSVRLYEKDYKNNTFMEYFKDFKFADDSTIKTYNPFSHYESGELLRFDFFKNDMGEYVALFSGSNSLIYNSELDSFIQDLDTKLEKFRNKNMLLEADKARDEYEIKEKNRFAFSKCREQEIEF